jgi:hypothetical protein
MNNEMTTDNMSNEEVIEVLKGLVFGSFDRTTRKERQALDFVIKALEESKQGKFECRIKIKDLISMLLEFDMNEKATIHTTDEYKENNIIISITDTRGKEE